MALEVSKRIISILFKIYANSKPLNFWFYKPQCEEDKAPLKK